MRNRFIAFCGTLAVALATRAGAYWSTQIDPAQKVCPPCSAVAAAQSGLTEIPAGALRERDWALRAHGINVPWAPGEKDNGRWPGAGATIVQIDTGVTNHPLILRQGPDDGGVYPKVADGLFGPGSTNLDTLLTGFLRFPGHGTKTSSVIAARPIGVMNGLFGVAPGAKVIPIRATEGVMLFDGPIGEVNADFHRIAQALNVAAKGAAGILGQKVDVVSMSLGGWPPTSDLCVAVKNATDAGIIVVVAAGNQVKKTKYPAKCPTAIAVAGSTYNSTPWSGSAGSPEVPVAAPAEGVWTASVMNGTFCVEASSGTSFATALVAGMAAEWVARHRAAGDLPAVPHEAFRKALRESARPWEGRSASSWARKYGPGIADMTALLKTKIQP